MGFWVFWLGLGTGAAPAVVASKGTLQAWCTNRILPAVCPIAGATAVPAAHSLQQWHSRIVYRSDCVVVCATLPAGGFAALKTHRYADAARELEIALRLNATLPAEQFNLAGAYGQLGWRADACRPLALWLQAFLEAGPAVAREPVLRPLDYHGIPP